MYDKATILVSMNHENESSHGTEGAYWGCRGLGLGLFVGLPLLVLGLVRVLALAVLGLVAMLGLALLVLPPLALGVS